jgi:hypothetical protein
VEPTVVRTEVGDDIVRVEGFCTSPSVLSSLAVKVGESETGALKELLRLVALAGATNVTGALNKLFRLVALAGATNVKLLDKIAKRLDASSLSTASVVYVVVE